MTGGNGLQVGNICGELPDASTAEVFQELVSRPGVRIERIVSHGQTTASGEWYDQSWDEWVMLVAGGAHLLIQGEVAARSLMPGDYLFLPAGCRHRVEWTDLARETVWLAVHIGKDAAGGG